MNDTTGKTPEQAAYEASARTLHGDDFIPWESIGNLRVSWKAAAQAAIDWWHRERDLEPPRTLTVPAPEMAAAMRETRIVREILARVFGSFSAPDRRRMRRASVHAVLIEQLKREAGLTPRDEEAAAIKARAAAPFTPYQLADDAIGLFLEYRDKHGYDEEAARSAAALEVAEGAAVTDAELADEQPAVAAADTRNSERDDLTARYDRLSEDFAVLRERLRNLAGRWDAARGLPVESEVRRCCAGQLREVADHAESAGSTPPARTGERP